LAGLKFAKDEVEQGGFADAIAPDNGGFLAGIDHEIKPGKEQVFAAFKR
jgi:hypothetical protein